MNDDSTTTVWKKKPDQQILAQAKKIANYINARVNADSKIYPNSVEGAAAVFSAIGTKDAKTAAAVLVAEMQSGKTSMMILMSWMSA